MKYQFPIVALFTILLVTSCTLQHRRYMSGFYFNQQSSVPNGKKKERVAQKEPDKSNVSEERNQSVPVLRKQNSSLTFEHTKENAFGNYSGVNADTLKNNCTDTIWYTNGIFVPAFILQINNENIKYQTCGSSDRVKEISIKDVKKVRYEGQIIEGTTIRNDAKLQEPKEKPSSVLSNLAVSTSVTSLIAFILSVLFFLEALVTFDSFLGIVSVVFFAFSAALTFRSVLSALIISLLAVNQTNRKPEIHLGGERARSALMLSIAIILAICLMVGVLLLTVAFF